MATPSYSRSLVCAAKRLKISTPTATQCQHQTRNLRRKAVSEETQSELSQIRLPRAVQATYLAPLKRQPTHSAEPVCDLQLRSYSLRNLEVFADFALRAAYFLHLPASGPVPLPKITERWTVPRSSFIFKKSQENFERITLRRLIQIQDGNPQAVSIWLSFLKKYQYYGVGMKANVFEHSGLDVEADLDKAAEEIHGKLGETLRLFGGRKGLSKDEQKLNDLLHTEPFKAQWGGYAAMGGAGSVRTADKRIELNEVTGER